MSLNRVLATERLYRNQIRCINTLTFLVKDYAHRSDTARLPYMPIPTLRDATYMLVRAASTSKKQLPAPTYNFEKVEDKRKYYPFSPYQGQVMQFEYFGFAFLIKLLML